MEFRYIIPFDCPICAQYLYKIYISDLEHDDILVK